MRSNTKTGRQSPILSVAIIDLIPERYAFGLRMREGFRLVRGPRVVASNPTVLMETRRAVWTGKIMLYSSDDEAMQLLDERVNSLPAPFELEWRRRSGKPWDWKLARVNNSAFEIPADVY